MALPPGTVTRDTLIALKITYNDTVKKIRLPLSDLTATVLPARLRQHLNIPPRENVLFERYSDSAGGYIVLDKTKIPVYKALVRAAKAKGKLRLRATLIEKPAQAQEEAPVAATEPVVPVETTQASPVDMSRDFTSAQPRMTGAGIFEYRAAQRSQQLSSKNDVPVPQPFAIPEMQETTSPAPHVHNLAFRTRNTISCPAFAQAAWSVYCNECDVAMSDVHYHCSICDGGDYDLCESCVNSGKLCPGEDHWLIKRFIRDGKVVTSVTERVGRKFQKEALEVKTMPGSFTEEAKPAPKAAPLPQPTRTCNSCVAVLPEQAFITCKDCEDFDLCVMCHTANAHGHNPKHAFEPVNSSTVLPLMAHTLLRPGRNVAHDAICDLCDKKIYGIRHKCLDCPDWDVCNSCRDDAATVHPVHRFAAITEPLSEPSPNLTRHFGIYCDGPQCRARPHQSYIIGDRYKCAVCHDTDFCASCEASPISSHNRTHPLIKFRTPVRNVSITTTNEDIKGNVRSMGDKKRQSVASKSPEVEAVAPTESADVNTATAVQTVAEIPPTVEDSTEVHKVQPKDGDVLLTSSAPPSPPRAPISISTGLLTAAFVRDSIPDGTLVHPGSVFTQIWTLRNEGPYEWPAGCSVKYVGGDNMLNVDNGRPASVSDLARAVESNVVAREVKVGEEVSFSITLRAPVREGKSISYWRLKAADGRPFGHRLWCDIEVRSHAVQTTSAATIINAPMEPMLTVCHTPASYQDTLRELNRTNMLRLAQAKREQGLSLGADRRVVSGPLPSTSFAPYTIAAVSSLAASNGRVEAARARVDALKTKIMQQRAEEAKTAEMEKPADAEVPASSVPISVKADDEADTGAASTSSSQMIFPKLEKESPASSIISSAKPAYVQSEAGEVEQSAAIHEPEQDAGEEAIADPAVEDFDVLEVVSAGIASDDEDDGFLTDEEYDILDASDSETVASP